MFLTMKQKTFKFLEIPVISIGPRMANTSALVSASKSHTSQFL